MSSNRSQAADQKQFRSLAASLAISLAVIAGALALVDDLNPSLIMSRLLWPLTRLMLFIVLGLVIDSIYRF